MAKFIPWPDFEPMYAKSLKSRRKGPPVMSVRVALGTLIIKERLGLSDRETVEQIRESPYLQHLLGFKDYNDEIPFDASMLVHFGKRIDKDFVCRVSEQINQKAVKAAKSEAKSYPRANVVKPFANS